MRRVILAVRGLVALVIVLGFMAALAAPIQASSIYARTEFHVAECPENTFDVFGKCHDNRVGGVAVEGCNPTLNCKTKFTDSNGVVRFGPRAGSNRYTVDVSGYEGLYIYCSAQNRKRVFIDRFDADGRFTINTRAGDIIVCDAYLLTEKK
jgi:hypothetical protein